MAAKIRLKNKTGGSDKGSNKKRIADILDVIFAYAQLNFNKKANVKADGTYIDAVATGINMLGEELQHSTISLKEKEVLIREIHHRVKNNLAIISGLINMQSAKAKDDYHRELFNDCRNRLMAISYIHQQLYFSNDFSKLDFAVYIADILALTESTFAHEKVQITTELENVIINIEKAVPCSLILNELVTNCYKHAFKGMSADKKIFIGLQKKNKKIELVIRDNGPGIDKSKKVKDSVGISLINDLVQQLDGEVSWQKKNGTEVIVKFSN